MLAETAAIRKRDASEFAKVLANSNQEAPFSLADWPVTSKYPAIPGIMTVLVSGTRNSSAHCFVCVLLAVPSLSPSANLYAT